MPRKANILNRISRIFNTKDVTHHNNTLQLPQPPPLAAITTASTIHDNSSLPILLQRAPSSKLLIDDFDITTLEYSYSYSDIHNSTKQQPQLQENHRQSWFSTISKLKTLKHHHNKKSSNKRKSSECWFVAQQQGADEIPDQQQQEGVQDKIMSSPLSVTSSLFSSSVKEEAGHHFSSSSSSSWLPADGNTSTARTSIDSQHQNKDFLMVVQPKKNGSCISLAENVKNILGDAIYLADQELDV